MLMEECDIWYIMINLMTTTCIDMQMACLGELQREMTCVGGNTFLLKR